MAAIVYSGRVCSDVESIAELLARHAELAVLGAALTLAASTALVWRLVRAVSPRLASLFDAATGRFPAAGRYLTLHIVVSFVVALAALGAFFELADELDLDEDLARFDVALSAALANEVGDGTLTAFALVTRLGDTAVLLAVVLVVAAYFAYERQRLIAWSWIATTAGGALLNWTLKQLFGRARPVHDHGFSTAEGLSFPSGHSAGSMVVYGFLCYVLIQRVHARWHLALVITWLLLVVAVGSSRVLLQVHYFSDVLAGWASALCWLALAVTGLEALRRRRSAALSR
jgi:undecaprenyl-diphosphatase